MRMDELNRITRGSTISCTDVFDDSFEGEVLAVDTQAKAVVICIGNNLKANKSTRPEIRIVNMAHVQRFEIVKQQDEPPEMLPAIDFEKLAALKRKNVEEKRKAVRYVGSGVSETAQNLMNHLSRIFCESDWHGKDIVILEKVIIKPPYRRENCECYRQADPEKKILEMVQQQVEKFHRENQKTQASAH